MSEYIEVGQPLQFTDPNTPTRVGEMVENVSDIYNIPSPRLGMQVFVKNEKKSFVITSLKSKVINGVDVPEAAVEAFEPVGAKSITWNNDTNPSNMNDFVVAGVYDIIGERTRSDDNLPFGNTGGGHTFHARLEVLESSIAPEDQSDDICITQKLTLSNRVAGDGDVYIRTGRGTSKAAITWETWGKLQQNIEVGSVTTLDNLIDNGIYSGAYVGTGSKFTFVMVVINDYALAGKLGVDRTVNQFLYAVEPNGVTRYTTRKKIGGAPWGKEDILNEKEITSMIEAAVTTINQRISNLIGEAPETLDTLKEIADWVENHEDLYAALKQLAEDNTNLINAETTRAKDEENVIKSKATHFSTLHFTPHEDYVNLGGKTVDGQNTISLNIPSATTEKAGVMTAEDKKKLDSLTPGGGSGGGGSDGTALRSLFIAACAEYNDTDNHIVKDTPWKDRVDSVDYKAQWNLDVVTGSIQKLTYGGKTYEYVDDNGTWKIIARVGDKLIWDDTKVIHRVGCYHLNGLGDITESQMMEIYDYTFPLTGASDWSSTLRRNSNNDNLVRTNILKKDFYTNHKIKVLAGAFYSSMIEVVRLTGANDTNWSVPIGANSSQGALSHAIANAKKVRYILGVMDFKNQKTDSAYFGANALSITVLRVKNLVGNFVSFGNSKTISKSSVLYIIQNAIPTSAITITLHADAYARLKDDADIVAALAAQPLITLVSA